MKISSGAYSTKGVRKLNEDSFLLAVETGGATDAGGAEFSTQIQGLFFFAVADGMGGHDAGDVASAFVVQKLRERAVLAEPPVDDTKIEEILQGIHGELVAMARQRGTPNMGSTVTGIVLQDGAPGYFNAGDSRVYRLRHGYLQQLTNDDSLAAIDPRAKKNIITNAVGAGQERMRVASRFSANIAVANDVFLMCSDGVHGALNDDELTLLLGLADTPADIAKTIVERAVANNSDDNCTAMVVKIESAQPDFPSSGSASTEVL